MAPSSEDQVQFLLKLQRLLGEGLFTATYKYALLMALADLSVELGDDSGEELEMSRTKLPRNLLGTIGVRRCPSSVKKPYDRTLEGRRLLLHSCSKFAMSVVTVWRRRKGMRLNGAVWSGQSLTTSARCRYRGCRHVGCETLPFLYDPPAVRGPAVIRLYPGVAFCLRRFHGLVAELVQAAWTRWVRQQNLSIIGDTADLHEFLFGVERANLALLQKPLRDLQRNTCFYCHHEMRGRPDVDHFVPWILYQLDLGHNFVLAHKECNSEKRDRLASEEHLAAWVDRNQKHGEALGREFDRLRVVHSLPSTIQIARWAYGSVSMANGLTWKARETLVPLRGDWTRFLA